MKFGYVSAPKIDKQQTLTIEEQSSLITSRYPDADITEEIYDASSNRPALSALIERCSNGDSFVVVSFDRLSIDAKDALDCVERLRSKNTTIHILNIGVIDDAPIGKTIIECLYRFVKANSIQIAERMLLGKARAKKTSKLNEGRPRKFTEQQIEDALEMLKSHSYEAVSKEHGLSISTLTREKRRHASMPLYFYGHRRTVDYLKPFSNFYPSPFIVEGVHFLTGEQCYQYRKAVYFADESTAEKIINEVSPGKCKKLGGQTKNFDSATWNNVKGDIMTDVVYQKFSQNEHLKGILLSTENRPLVEASPKDREFGIGISREEAMNGVPWEGKNLLGEALMKVRDMLREEAK